MFKLKKELDHIAIVVKNIKKQLKWFCDIYDAKKIGKIFIYPEQGVKIQFLKSSNFKIELLEKYGKNSPIKNYLSNNELSKFYHIAYAVKNLNLVSKEVKKRGGKIISRTKNGWRGNEVMFVIFFKGQDYQLIEYVKKK